MLRGDSVNESEGRAALHTALRAPRGAAPVLVDGADVHAAIHDTLDRVYAFAASNVDPVDAARVLEDSDPETTLFVVVSKSFATAETLLNAQVCRDWLVARLPGVNPAMAVAGHFAPVFGRRKAANFGAEPDNVFGFGDYVGGRFSVHSPVGALPWPSTSGRAVALPAHVQQLDMESNGKSVAPDGPRRRDAGEIIFGEPGTNGQHSFYQLMHQGRAVPAEFIGFCESQRHAKGRPLSCHDELMANFFAQPDALAMGDVDEAHPERACPGNRPSLSLLLPRLDAPRRFPRRATSTAAVQSFLFGNNAFDQWGVQLGKVLAGRVADALGDAAEAAALNSSTRCLLAAYRRHALASIEAVASGS
ncbi:glucose-6-phosphate isomerase [Aureococcus anophagefferens]|nr:glucose-6-phosphate isomerase [Aureococcus anophagefferens]